MNAQDSTVAAASPAAHALPLQAQGLRLGYGGRLVLDGLDWQLSPGQVVGLLGRNGAGKTTLLESVLGLRDLDAGQALVFGQSSLRLDDAARARIGYVPQRSDLFENLTGHEMLAYFRSFYPRWNAARVEHLLQRWAVDCTQPIGRLSGGQQQRLSIVRALAHEPELLVLDEPVASLDPSGRRDFLRELVEQVLDRPTTVVFSTHILSDLERVAVDVAFLRQGRIALQAPLDALLDEVRAVVGEVVGAVVGETGQGVQGPLPAGAVELARRGTCRWLRSADPALWPRLEAQGLRVARVSLDDLFEVLA